MHLPGICGMMIRVMIMTSEIRIFPRENGEIQRVQILRPRDWSELNFLRPVPYEGAIDRFYRIYRQFLVPAAPWVFGNIVMFRLPADLRIPEELAKDYAHVADPLTVAALVLRRGIAVTGEQVICRNRQVRRFWLSLKERDCIRIVRGKLPITQIIPVGNEAGFLTETPGKMKANSSFFIMDTFDCATPFDHIGIPFGLMVKDGVVESPPLFSREALLVRRDGSVSVEQPQLRQLRVRIGDEVFTHGENARFHWRPEYPRTLPGKKAIVIIGRRVEAVCKGSTPVPASGFVICPQGPSSVKPGDTVTYEGMEDIRFGIQVGNSIVRNGVQTKEFISRFYNVKGISRTAFPPSLYPLDFDHARAARMAIGADAEGKPMLLWAEGAAKVGHTPGGDSCGASLLEMAQICADVGMHNAVNLDGGGSAQILVDGQRSLMISDRKDEDATESERPVPMGLVIY